MRKRTFDVISAQPWLMSQESLEKLLAIANREGNPEEFKALLTSASDPLPQTSTVEMVGDIAVLSVSGPIFRYANLFMMMSGATSLQMMAQDFQKALADQDVRGIILDIDSPGGQAQGIHEFAEQIFDARGNKPVWAYSGAAMQSAAYWIGSAAEQIVIDRTAMVGSIGIISEAKDTSERDGKSGVKTYVVVSSQSPKKALTAGTEAGRLETQRVVDSLGQIFIETMARNRGQSVEHVLSQFGQGHVLVGEEAVRAGLADRLGSLESTISAMAAAVSPYKRVFSMSNVAMKGAVTVLSLAAYQAAVLAGHQAQEITVDFAAVEKKGFDAGKLEGIAEGKATGATEATAAERLRISGLQDLAGKDNQELIAAAIKDGASIGETAIKIAQKAKDNGTTLAAQQNDATRTSHGGQGKDPTAATGAKQEGALTAAQVAARHGGPKVS